MSDCTARFREVKLVSGVMSVIVLLNYYKVELGWSIKE